MEQIWVYWPVYWFARFDVPSQKFTEFQSLAGLEDAPPHANATDMIDVSHRFIQDWKDGNMTDFAQLLAPNFIADEQSGNKMNRSMFLMMHNYMWDTIITYQCQYPATTVHCDYVVDELAQTTQCNLTKMEPGGHMQKDVPQHPLLTKMVDNTEPGDLQAEMGMPTGMPGGKNHTNIMFTAEYQFHLYRLVKPEVPIPGLPFQIEFLSEYEDLHYNWKPLK